jgi:hypothetical protein
VATTTTTSAATTTTAVEPWTEDAAVETVRAFAEDVVGMVDPVVEWTDMDDSAPPQATVEVRTRREGGEADPSLTPTVVSLVGTEDGGWRIVTATSDLLIIEAPPPDMRLSAGFVTPSGQATAFEGTVVVRALVGTEVVAEEVATAEGTQDALWATRLELGSASGDGYILAFTTSGTELGPPVFALAPVTFGPA